MCSIMSACPRSSACANSLAPALPPGSHLLLLNCRLRAREGEQQAVLGIGV